MKRWTALCLLSAFSRLFAPPLFVWASQISNMYFFLKKQLLVNWLAPKKGAISRLIYFFKPFCICYIPHNYVISQAMPHAILQTHSAFYPHHNGFIFQIINSLTETWRVRLTCLDCKRKRRKFKLLFLLRRNVELNLLPLTHCEWKSFLSLLANAVNSGHDRSLQHDFYVTTLTNQSLISKQNL